MTEEAQNNQNLTRLGYAMHSKFRDLSKTPLAAEDFWKQMAEFTIERFKADEQRGMSSEHDG